MLGGVSETRLPPNFWSQQAALQSLKEGLRDVLAPHTPSRHRAEAVSGAIMSLR
jgi:hypothetical protein